MWCYQYTGTIMIQSFSLVPKLSKHICFKAPTGQWNINTPLMIRKYTLTWELSGIGIDNWNWPHVWFRQYMGYTKYILLKILKCTDFGNFKNNKNTSQLLALMADQLIHQYLKWSIVSEIFRLKFTRWFPAHLNLAMSNLLKGVKPVRLGPHNLFLNIPENICIFMKKCFQINLARATYQLWINISL